MGEIRSTRREKSVPVPLCEPQIPYAQGLKPLSVASGLRLTVWVIPLPLLTDVQYN